MFLRGQRVSFVLKHGQSADNLGTSLRRVNDVVYVATTGGYVDWYVRHRIAEEQSTWSGVHPLAASQLPTRRASSFPRRVSGRAWSRPPPDPAVACRMRINWRRFTLHF